MTIRSMRYGMYTALGASAFIVGGSAIGFVNSKEMQKADEQAKPVIEEKLARAPIQKAIVITVKKEIVDPKTAMDNFVPTIDVLRVEKNRTILVAGRAGPKQIVELARANGTVLGSTQADSGGDFIILPPKPLEPGDYVLRLIASDKAGNTMTSSQATIIHIPKSGGEILAMITRSGEATRIMVKPKSLVSKGVVKESLEPLPEFLKTIPKPKPPLAPRIIIEAVEVEKNKVFVAGEVKHKSLVRIYIDNKIIGTARGTVANRFLMTEDFALAEGKHLVRVDVIDPKTGRVLSRAEVPLYHQLPKLAPPKLALTEKNRLRVIEPKKPADKKKRPNQPENKVAKLSVSDPKSLRSGTTIIIKPGDNLWTIARRTYGRGIRYTTIYNANRDQIRDPSKIYVGQVFKIPEKAE